MQPEFVNQYLADWLLRLLRSDDVSIKGPHVQIALQAQKWLEVIAATGAPPASAQTAPAPPT